MTFLGGDGADALDGGRCARLGEMGAVGGSCHFLWLDLFGIMDGLSSDHASEGSLVNEMGGRYGTARLIA